MALPVSTAGNSATSTSISVSKPSGGWVSGNTLIAVVTVAGVSTTPTTPSGWTLVASTSNGSSFSMAVFEIVLTSAGASSYTFSGATGTLDISAVIAEYSGTYITSGIVDNTTVANGSGTTATWTALTTTYGGEAAILALGVNTATVSGSWPSGYTLEISEISTIAGVYLADQRLAFGGSGSSTGSNSVTLSATDSWGAITVALVPLRVYLTNTATGLSWTVPSTWNDSSNTIEAIGGGGGSSNAYDAAGGGGGAYAAITNLSLVSGNSVSYSVGVGGTGGAAGNTANPGTSGTNTWFSSTTTLLAAAGEAYSSGTNYSVPGGSAANSVGTTKYSGGTSYVASSGSESQGGGGAAGPKGAGGNSGSSTGSGSTNTYWGGTGGGGGGGGTSSSFSTTSDGTNGGNNAAGTGGGSGSSSSSSPGSAGTNGGGGGGGFGSNSPAAITGGGNGGNGTEWDSTHGSGGGGGGSSFQNAVYFTSAPSGGNGGLYGGGGGAGGLYGPSTTEFGAGGNGGQGIIVITWAAVVPSPGTPITSNHSLLSESLSYNSSTNKILLDWLENILSKNTVSYEELLTNSIITQINTEFLLNVTESNNFLSDSLERIFLNNYIYDEYLFNMEGINSILLESLQSTILENSINPDEFLASSSSKDSINVETTILETSQENWLFETQSKKISEASIQGEYLLNSSTTDSISDEVLASISSIDYSLLDWTSSATAIVADDSILLETEQNTNITNTINNETLSKQSATNSSDFLSIDSLEQTTSMNNLFGEYSSRILLKESFSQESQSSIVFSNSILAESNLALQVNSIQLVDSLGSIISLPVILLDGFTSGTITLGANFLDAPQIFDNINSWARSINRTLELNELGFMTQYGIDLTETNNPPPNFQSKYPNDYIDYSWKFTDFGLSNDYIIQGDIIGVTPSGSLSIKSKTLQQGKYFTIWVSGGTENTIYGITFQVVSDQGRIVIGTSWLPVLGVAPYTE